VRRGALQHKYATTSQSARQLPGAGSSGPARTRPSRPTTAELGQLVRPLGVAQRALESCTRAQEPAGVGAAQSLRVAGSVGGRPHRFVSGRMHRLEDATK
jgi:hypothetical protein